MEMLGPKAFSNSHLYQSTFPPTMHEGFLFPTSSPTSAVCWFIDGSHSDRCEVISLCGFNLHFSNNYWCWASFHVSIGHLYVLFGEVSIQVFCPLFNWTVWVFDVELYAFFIHFEHVYLLPCSRLSFHFVDVFLNCAKPFQVDVVPFLYFSFVSLAQEDI